MILEGRFWHPQRGLTDGCVAIGDDGMIKRVAKTISGAKERVCGMLLPAALDMHVHFRDAAAESERDGTVVILVIQPNVRAVNTGVDYRYGYAGAVEAQFPRQINSHPAQIGAHRYTCR